MAEGKRSFLLYSDLITVVSLLNDEQAGKLFKTILEYVNDQDPEPEDFVTKIAFEPIKLQLKRDLRGWDEQRQKRSDAGKKGMENRWHPITNDNSVINPITNITDNVTVNVNDTVNVKREYRRFSPPTPEEVYDEMCKKLDEFTAAGESSKFFDYYTANGWKVGRHQMKDWKAAVRNWIRNSIKFSKNANSKGFNGNSRNIGANQLVESLRADFKP